MISNHFSMELSLLSSETFGSYDFISLTWVLLVLYSYCNSMCMDCDNLEIHRKGEKSCTRLIDCLFVCLRQVHLLTFVKHLESNISLLCVLGIDGIW